MPVGVGSVCICWGVCVCVCVCVCVYRCVQSRRAELPSLPQGCCPRAWSSAPLRTTTQCAKVTTPRSGRETRRVLPLHLAWGEMILTPRHSPHLPCQERGHWGPDSGPRSAPGPQCPHLSNGWRNGDHHLGCCEDSRVCTHALSLESLAHCAFSSESRAYTPPALCLPSLGLSPSL